MIRAIETRYDGYRFRSRTEARWAVFFKTAGVKYEYEPQGFVLDGLNYLPDFWLPDSSRKGGGIWFEVKGIDPTGYEKDLCLRLAKESGCVCIIAVGSPEATCQGQIIRFDAENVQCIPGCDMPRDYGICSDDMCGPESRYGLEDDSFKYDALWLTDSGPTSPNKLIHKTEFIGSPTVDSGYAAARAARFEFGESGAGRLQQPNIHDFGQAARRIRYGVRE